MKKIKSIMVVLAMAASYLQSAQENHEKSIVKYASWQRACAENDAAALALLAVQHGTIPTDKLLLYRAASCKSHEAAKKLFELTTNQPEVRSALVSEPFIFKHPTEQQVKLFTLPVALFATNEAFDLVQACIAAGSSPYTTSSFMKSDDLPPEEKIYPVNVFELILLMKGNVQVVKNLEDFMKSTRVSIESRRVSTVIQLTQRHGYRKLKFCLDHNVCGARAVLADNRCEGVYALHRGLTPVKSINSHRWTEQERPQIQKILQRYGPQQTALVGRQPSTVATSPAARREFSHTLYQSPRYGETEVRVAAIESGSYAALRWLLPGGRLRISLRFDLDDKPS